MDGLIRTSFVALVVLVGVIESRGQKISTYDQKIPGTQVTFKMIGVPGGKFTIGSKSSLSDPDESPTAVVGVTAFWMSEHEVTFGEWDAYFKDSSLPQSRDIDGITRATPQYIDLTWGMGRDAGHPANSMSQQAAMMYCQWLYAKTGIFFRLPTEAEWEYACVSGKTDADQSSLNQIGYYKDNASGKYHHVKELKPNSLGLYDMLGNLSEWTLDQYDPSYYTRIGALDPMTTPGARYPRTTRGGSFRDNANQLRCSNRIPSDPNWNQRDPQVPKSRWWLTDGMFVGFRVVRPVRQPGKLEAEQFYERYFR